ncbi:MAG: bifunctional serine/threonine-protein kinase/formylglycine-generating enzyme family protein [Acidobacteriota bacterium]|nr:bifunctional serine/threonine-protein kinase/formylglycine-generating enzyme family protein [Acidobacteriota bacterium]
MDKEDWAKMKELLNEVEHVPVENREAWLLDRCGDNTVLLEQMYVQLNEEAPDTSDLIMQQPPSVFDQKSLVGLQLGPWRLVRELGSGGMGAVWSAERADAAFRMSVAVKLIKGATLHPDLIARFKRERQLLADLKHQNICMLLDGGDLPDGDPYLVMELIEGETIDLWCGKRNAGFEDILELFRQACQACAYAHRKGVLHRDIKPANIMVTTEGLVKLMDFGIAARHDVALTSLTGSGLTPMTPEYAAPEQLRGAPASTASDIYGLGLIWLQLCFRQRPRQFMNNLAVTLEDFLETLPPGFSHVAVRSLMLRLTAHNPKERPASVEEVCSLLDRLKGSDDAGEATRYGDTSAVTAPSSSPAETSSQPATRLPFEPETTAVPAGSFTMGRQPDPGVPNWETPAHTVTLPAYRIGRFPVTNSQYHAYLQRNRDAAAPPAKAGWLLREPPSDRMDHPVVGISFFDALQYCGWLSEATGKTFALPTEAEWERAAGDGREYPWGEEWDPNLLHCEADATVPVTNHESGKSPFGCYHMAGNVQEWTACRWGLNARTCEYPYPYREGDGRNDPSLVTQQSFIIHRGGSFRDDLSKCNCKSRGFSNASGRYLWRGFRVVLR